MTDMYDADYFLRGRKSGKSLYDNYRWIPELTLPMVDAIIDHLGIADSDTILDFGCARGYVVRALRAMGYKAWGVDISTWAVDNCDPEVVDYVRHYSGRGTYWRGKEFDWVIAKDVLEHVPNVQDTILYMMDAALVGLFVVVPLGDGTGRYVVPEYEEDVTHVHRLTLASWTSMFIQPGWLVEVCYRVPGVKDNYAQHERGNGFITARRTT